MIYLSGAVSPRLVGRPDVGFMLSPRMGNRAPAAPTVWAADCGTYPTWWHFDLDTYLAFLERHAWAAPRALFAVCPDAIGDGPSTAANVSVLADIRALGYPTAYVAQPDVDLDALPWDLIDCLFLGGADWWQQEAAPLVVAAAHVRGKWAHRGRVNRRGRLRMTYTLGFDSCDGTLAAFGPDINGPKLLAALDELRHGAVLL